MKNLVVGSEGFVGRPFCGYLERCGEQVVRFDIKRGNHEDARCETLPLEGVDRVYVLAWEVGGAKYLYRDESQFAQLDWNLALMKNVFRQLRKADLPFLFVSSQLAQEVDTVYGATKRLGEVWTHLLPKGVCVRLWNVYGGYEDSTERSHVVADFVHQALDTGAIRMLTTGEERRQFVHIDDVCRAFHAALSKGVREIHDASTFEWSRVFDVAKVIGELTGATVVPGEKVGSTPITPNLAPIPGWEASVSLCEGLPRMVEDFRRRKAERKVVG
jgi:nucleoside-diphosphate-sugar epimerase